MQFFTTYIYAPFFNILVGLYWLIGKIFGEPDMGVAVILFALVVRLILLPLDFAGDRSAKEKHDIAEKIKELEKTYRHEPVRLKAEIKKIMRSSPGAVISETAMIVIQLIIILMLYRIFKTGLEGADLHLLYKFMPPVETPINLVFLDRFDLSRTNSTLNLIQSFLIFAIEALHMFFSPKPTNRRDFISLAILLPIVSFLIFMFLPAGKKLFIITSLLFSIAVALIKQAIYLSQTVFTVKAEASSPPHP